MSQKMDLWARLQKLIDTQISPLDFILEYFQSARSNVLIHTPLFFGCFLTEIHIGYPAFKPVIIEVVVILNTLSLRESPKWGSRLRETNVELPILRVISRPSKRKDTSTDRVRF